MSKLTLSDWAHIAEIFTSVIVIISLVYVGLEVNQNTQSLQNESYLNVMERLTDQDLALAANEDLHRIVMVANTSPTDVSAEEWSRYVYYTFPRFGMWEYLYLAKQQNAINDFQWLAFDPYFRGFICSKGSLRFWEENQSAYATNFRVYLNTKIVPECSEQKSES